MPESFGRYDNIEWAEYLDFFGAASESVAGLDRSASRGFWQRRREHFQGPLR